MLSDALFVNATERIPGGLAALDLSEVHPDRCLCLSAARDALSWQPVDRYHAMGLALWLNQGQQEAVRIEARRLKLRPRWG